MPICFPNTMLARKLMHFADQVSKRYTSHCRRNSRAFLEEVGRSPLTKCFSAQSLSHRILIGMLLDLYCLTYIVHHVQRLWIHRLNCNWKSAALKQGLYFPLEHSTKRSSLRRCLNSARVIWMQNSLTIYSVPITMKQIASHVCFPWSAYLIFAT